MLDTIYGRIGGEEEREYDWGSRLLIGVVTVVN